MAGDPWSVVNDLEPMTWRGLEAPPYDIANFSGGYSLAEKRYPYIDGASHDNTGRNPIPMTFKFYFLNTVRPDTFPDLFDEWVKAVVLDGSSGLLEHPVLGDIQARPATWSVELTANATAGIILNVNFVETIDDPSKATGSIITTAFPVINAAAEAADIDYSKLNLPWPDGARTDNLLDLGNQLEGLVFSARLTAEGALNQAMGLVGGLIDNVESINSNVQWALVGNLVTLYNALSDLGDRLGVSAERAVGTASFDYDTSVDEVAKTLNNTVGEIMTLNSSLLGAPAIPAGSTVRYFTES